MSRAEKQQRRRKRLLKKRGLSRLEPLSRLLADDAPADLQLVSYDITYDPLPEEPRIKPSLPFSPEERRALFELTDSDPTAAVLRLNLLLEQHPGSPMLLNWLTVAYNHLRDEENSDRVALLNYECNADYLFARINYAMICLARGQTEKVDEIFDRKFDLKLLYPHRNVFHISEYVGFAGVMIQYHMRKENTRAAEIMYSTLKKLAPEHNVTHAMSRLMEGSTLLQLAKKMSRSLLGRGELS